MLEQIVANSNFLLQLPCDGFSLSCSPSPFFSFLDGLPAVTWSWDQNGVKDPSQILVIAVGLSCCSRLTSWMKPNIVVLHVDIFCVCVCVAFMCFVHSDVQRLMLPLKPLCWCLMWGFPECIYTISGVCERRAPQILMVNLAQFMKLGFFRSTFCLMHLNV